MATRTAPGTLDSLDRWIALEIGVVAGLFALVYVWGDHVGGYFLGMTEVVPGMGVPGVLFVTHVSFVAGLALLGGAYVRVRDLEVGLALPAREHLPLVGSAAAVPAALVGLTAATAALTGTSLGDVASNGYPTDPSAAVVVTFVLLTPLVVSVGYALLYQVLVQETLRASVERRLAALLTATVAAFLLFGSSGGLPFVPDRGHLLGAVLFAIAIGVAGYGNERIDRAWLRPLAAVPALTIFAVAILEAVVGIGTIADGLFLATHLAALGVAAVGYERTRSLFVPATAYASLLVTTNLVLFAVEAGLQAP